MPIRTECSDCGKRYQFSEKMAGESVPCRECGHEIRIPGRRRGGQGGRRPRADHNFGPWYENPVAAVGAGAAIVLGGILWAVLADSGENLPGGDEVVEKSAEPSIPQGTPTPRSEAFSDPANEVASLPRRVPSAGRTPNSAIETPSTSTHPAGSPSSGFPGNMRNRPPFGQTPGQSALGPPPEPERWDVQPDPIEGLAGFSTKDVSIPLQRGNEIWYPPTPEPLMAIGRPPKEFQLVSLETLEVIGTYRLPLQVASTWSISPDGKRVVGAVTGSGGQDDTVYVVEASTGKVLNEFEAPGRVSRLLELIGEDRILMAATQLNRDESGIVRSSGEKIWIYPLNDGGSPQQVYSDGIDTDKLRLSPNRNYVAGVTRDGQFVVCDTKLGDRVGKVPLPKGKSIFSPSVVATSFSRDGQEFAAVLRRGGDHQLLNWDMGSGELTNNHTVKGISSRTDRTGTVQFLGKSGWLILNGSVGISRNSGNVVQVESASFIEQSPRKALGTEGTRSRVLALRGDRFRGGEFTTFEIDLPDGEASSQTTSERSPLASAKDFPLTEPLTAGARKFVADTGTVSWQSSVDPGVEKDTTRLDSELPISRDEVHDYLLSGNRVVLLEGERRTRRQNLAWSGVLTNRPSGSRLTAVAIPSGETDARIDIPQGSVLHDISPSGNLALTQRPDSRVVDLWSLADGIHVVGFEYAPVDRELSFAKLIDDQHLMIASMPDDTKRTIALWKVPECRMVYSIDVARRKIPAKGTFGKTELNYSPTPVAVSPGGRFMAIDLGDRMRLFDLFKGTVRGDLQMGRNRSFSHFSRGKVASFSPDGERLAFILPVDSRTEVTVWDLDSGELLSDDALNVTEIDASSLVWNGSSVLLLSSRYGYNWRMIDLYRRCVV